MNKNNLTLTLLSLSALILLIANFLIPAPQASGNMVIKDRDYSVATAQVQGGNDAVYVIDNRTGQMAVFVYDVTVRRLVPRDIRPVSDAFTGR